MLADYAAGIAHAALLPIPGRVRLPLTYKQATDLIGHLRRTGKLVVENIDFNIAFDEIFGPVMDQAREQTAS